MIAPFTFNTAPSIRFGEGLLDEIGPMLAADGHQTALIVTDAGMMATGIIDRALASLAASGITAGLYADVEADPPEAIVHAAVEAARAAGAGMIIGIGGGSSLDVAKLVACYCRDIRHWRRPMVWAMRLARDCPCCWCRQQRAPGQR